MDHTEPSNYTPDDHEYESVKNAALRTTNINFNDLQDFLRCRTVKSGSDEVNIFAPKIGAFNILAEDIPPFFSLLERCRKDGIRMHYCEKQQDYSGIMIDFDINHLQPVS